LVVEVNNKKASIPGSPRVWFCVVWRLLRWDRKQKSGAQKFGLGGEILKSIGMLQQIELGTLGRIGFTDSIQKPY